MASETKKNIMDSEQHSIKKSIVLHLLPGFLLLIFFIIVAPILGSHGFPSIFSLLIGTVFILFPFEFGYLLHQGKKKNRTFSLRGIILYRESIAVWQYFVFVPALLFWGFAVALLIARPLDNYLISRLFSWLPDWFFLDEVSNNLSRYPKSILMITMVFGFVFNGIVGPIVEELYFRGYLMPRLSRLRMWAPLISTFLFSLYHFFTPWQNPLRIAAILPLSYAVWWKRNVWIGIYVHCLLNSFGMVSTVVSLFGQI